MESTGPIDRISRSIHRVFVPIAVIAIMTTIAVSLYAASGTASNTLQITPRVIQPGLDAGSVAVRVTDVGESFSTRRRKNPQIGGEVLFQLDMGVPLDEGNLIFDILWTNSIDVTGPLSKDDALLRVGLFFLDSHQQRAKNAGYTGDCDEQVQREFRLNGVLTYVCPDPGPIAHSFSSRQL